ncbi:DUF6090 family protein [Winogradskyella sp. MIT101101]|uniref:DUF6090 family protein n=1 Tax=Winogradskyella sp. MIT101101 TaxID=3098297 RepID=UPI00399BDA1A
MIKFFRQIRYNLMEQNKTGKYFKYAIGEIILVVIGILIAIQINNWNENHKIQNEEKKILLALLKEFQNSKDDFIETTNTNDTIFNHVHEIFKHTGSKWDGSLSRQASDSLINRLLAGSTADISTSYLEETLNTGKIKIIQNEDLQFMLSNWKIELIDHKVETEARTRELLSNDIFPFVHQNYTLYIGRVKTVTDTPSGFITDYTKIYQSQAFENYVLLRLHRLRYTKKEYQILIDQCDEIISLIQSELKKQ